MTDIRGWTGKAVKIPPSGLKKMHVVANYNNITVDYTVRIFKGFGSQYGFHSSGNGPMSITVLWSGR